MDFLAPIMLVGAAGLAIPIVIHLIGRRRARRVRFAAMDFLLGSRRKTARRLRLRELILLATRVLICLAIPLALAKPFTSCAAKGPLVERGPQAAVLIIDDSFTAGYRVGDETLLGRAKSRARSIIEQLGHEADVAILRAAEGAGTPTELSRDHLGLADAVDGIEPSARPAAIATALRRAAQLLATSRHERRTAYLLTAVTAAGVAGPPPTWPTDGPGLVVVDLADGDTLSNLAITGLDVSRDPDSGSRGVRVVAEVTNFGPRPVSGHGIGLRVDGRVVARGDVTVGPGDTQSKQFRASLPARAADVVVELDADALAIDNRRYARAELRDEIRVLLVDGDPRTVRHDDELFYIEAALRPGDRGDSGAVFTSITVDELDDLDLGAFDVAVLANAVALSKTRAARLSAWVRAGGGLLVAPGDNTDPQAYAQTMQPLLPQPLHDATDAAYGARGTERAGRALQLSKWESEHPVFSVFSKDAPGLREARFTKIMLLGPTNRVDDRRVLARYTNGAAALVTARRGAGRVMLFTSTLDRDWNDLSIHPGYLPLMQEIVRFLARKQDRRARAPVLVGRDAVLSVGPDDTRIEVVAPSGARAVIEGDGLAGRKQVRFGQTAEPGLYRVQAKDAAGHDRRRPESDFAVNVDVRGSDIRSASPTALPATEGSDATIGPASHERRVELWHAVAVGLLILLLLESMLVLR